jgi:ATP-binding cassette, subfamily B, bacterial
VVLAYLSSLYGPIRALARLARTLARGAASRERVLEVLDSAEVVPQPADPVQAGPPRYGLVLRGAWFAYTEGAPALRHLDLEVAAGERVCVVGPTGAGKSTLLALLQRSYDPQAGVVELDGVDLRDLDLGSLRRQLALVPQDPWMLDGTIADNVAFGRSWGGSEGRTPPRTDQEPPRDEQLAAAAALAALDELVERLPDGWSTQIGEGGVRLSGGQRRRVALARAILRGASVPLLDEPTSGLDAASEQAVLDALDRADGAVGVTPAEPGRPRGQGGGPGRRPRGRAGASRRVAGRRRRLRPPLGPPAPARACTDRQIRRGGEPMSRGRGRGRRVRGGHKVFSHRGGHSASSMSRSRSRTRTRTRG